MKKRFYLALTLLALISLVATPVFAATRSLTLLDIYYVRNKGVVFTFQPTGTFKASELDGYATVGGRNYRLDCLLNDEGFVKCTGEQGLSRYVWQTASGAVAGFPFSGMIRANGYCYSLWLFSGGAWTQLSTICGSKDPADGDWIIVNGDTIAVYSSSGPNGAGFYVEAGGPLAN